MLLAERKNPASEEAGYSTRSFVNPHDAPRPNTYRSSVGVRIIAAAVIRKGKLNDMIYVSVIVPCRNEIRHIRAFLACLRKQELRGVEMEVLIADGRSDDGTRAVLLECEMEFADFRVLDNPEK